jgi:hypothetical protein
MAALCGSSCGYCGGCTAAWEVETDDLDRVEDDYPTCDVCEETIGADAVVTARGRFCSAACLDEALRCEAEDVPASLRGVA